MDMRDWDVIGRGKDILRNRITGQLAFNQNTLARRGGFAGEEEGQDGEFERLEGDDGFGAVRSSSKSSKMRVNAADIISKGQAPLGPDHKPLIPDGWVPTMVCDEGSISAAGQVTLTTRVQHDFILTDLTFEGSTTGAKIISIQFGDSGQTGWGKGSLASIFGMSSTLRGLLAGRAVRGGLDIIVIGTIPTPGTLQMAMTGFRPAKN